MTDYLFEPILLPVIGIAQQQYLQTETSSHLIMAKPVRNGQSLDCIFLADHIQSISINHVAVSVPSVVDAVAFYANICGFKLVGDTIHHLKRDESPNTSIFEMYPPGLKQVKVAMMTTGSDVGLEIMEFVDPPCVPAPEFEYNRGGWFHVCLTHPDPDAFVEEVIAAGGKRIGRTADPIGNGVRCVYVADPWGNAIEVLSISFSEITELASQALPA
jgi:catechol 2,3-dioxygenase-like lactoylglutathione lyase family enzyme